MSGLGGCGCSGSHGEPAKRDDKREKANETCCGGAVPDPEQREHAGEHSQNTERSEAPAAAKRRGTCCQ